MKKIDTPATFRTSLAALLTALISLSFGVSPAHSASSAVPELRSTLADQQEVAVTIYNNNLAMVRDVRRVQLGKGESTFSFRDVSAKMYSQTALLDSVSEPGSLSVLEQNFDFDLLTPQKLLEKYVGKKVSIIRTNPTNGVEKTETAEVLAAQNGTVLKIGDRIETGIPGRMVYDNVPANLRDRPTLVTLLHNSGATKQDVALSYLTAGLSWSADYLIDLNPSEDKINLKAWVTLTNKSGTTYNNAKLQLVAGTVNFTSNEASTTVTVTGFRAAVPPPPDLRKMTEESLFDYHLYTLSHPTTIADNQTKQVALFKADDVSARKEYTLQSGGNYSRTAPQLRTQKIAISYVIENTAQSNLGFSIPAGVVRAYKKDLAGTRQFIGEDKITHTPKNGEIRLRLGDAFDVIAQRRQTEFRQISLENAKNFKGESAHEIVLKNARKEEVTVRVLEYLDNDWTMLSESHPHVNEASNYAVWYIKIPAEGKTTLTYRVLIGSGPTMKTKAEP